MRLKDEQIREIYLELGRDFNDDFINLTLIDRNEYFIEDYSESYARSMLALEIRLDNKFIGYIKGDIYNIRKMNRARFSKEGIVLEADINSNFDATCMHDLVYSIQKNIKDIDSVAILDFVFCENKVLRKIILSNINKIIENVLNVDIDYVFISTIQPERLEFEEDEIMCYENVDCNRDSCIDESKFLKGLGFITVEEDSYAWKKRDDISEKEVSLMNLYKINLTKNQLNDLITLLIKQMANLNNHILFSENEDEFSQSVEGYLRMSLVCEKLKVLRLKKEQTIQLNVYEYSIVQYMFESMYWDCDYYEKYFKVPLQNVEILANMFNNISLSENCRALDYSYVFDCSLLEKLEIILENCTMK